MWTCTVIFFHYRISCRFRSHRARTVEAGDVGFDIQDNHRRPPNGAHAARVRATTESRRLAARAIPSLRSTHSPVHRRVRGIARVFMLTAGLALAITPFTYPAVSRAEYDPDYFSWCMENLQQGKAYCCGQAGGVISSGGCIDPASLYTPPAPTLTRNPGPPIIIVPGSPGVAP